MVTNYQRNMHQTLYYIIEVFCLASPDHSPLSPSLSNIIDLGNVELCSDKKNPYCYNRKVEENVVVLVLS